MLDLKRIRLIAVREWLTRLHQRSFQITTIVQVLFIVLGASLPTAVAFFSGDNAADTPTVLVVDGANAGLVDRLAPYVAGQESPLGLAGGTAIELQASGAAEDARRTVDQGDADAALIVARTGAGDLDFSFVNTSGENDSVAERVYAGASAITVEDRLERSGVDQRAYQAAIAPPAFQVQATQPGGAADQEDELDGARYGVGLGLTILMFMSIIVYGTWVAQGVVEEKSSRIMEIMVNAATPRDLLAGKVLGIGMAGLTQLVPMLLLGGIVFALQRRIAGAIGADTSMLAGIDFGSLSATAVGWFLVYFLLGFTMYAAMYAALGSLVSRQEEVNQAISPMMTVMFVGYFGALFSINASDNLFARILAIFPLTSPFVMISRTVMGRADGWQIALSLALLAATLILAVLFAARVYRVGVLMYGQKPSWRALFTAGRAQAVR